MTGQKTSDFEAAANSCFDAGTRGSIIESSEDRQPVSLLNLLWLD